jgi:hypothetical protein
MASIIEKSFIIETRQRCAVCDSVNLDAVLDLPKLPFTGHFSQKPMSAAAAHEGIDQKLLWCRNCFHAQLAFQVDPQELYNEEYYFRTSRSQTACRGTEFFLRTLDTFFPQKQFTCALDLGCNDLHLLGQLKSRAKERVGIDPIWKGKENTVNESSLTVFGEEIEHIDLGAKLRIAPDLVVCRHTLEHIYNPSEALDKLISAAAENAVFVIEVPSLNGLVQRLRFDQVFHQHLQYFSHASLRRVMTQLGARYIGQREHYHDWGAVCMVFVKGREREALDTQALREDFDLAALKKRYTIFKDQVRVANDTLMLFKGKEIYGYGAAQMLPVLAYHMNNDLSLLTGVLDDDPRLHEWYYWNLPLRIESPQKIKDWGNTDIFLTAVDNVQPIMNRLFTHRPRHIVYPLNII